MCGSSEFEIVGDGRKDGKQRDLFGSNALGHFEGISKGISDGIELRFQINKEGIAAVVGIDDVESQIALAAAGEELEHHAQIEAVVGRQAVGIAVEVIWHHGLKAAALHILEGESAGRHPAEVARTIHPGGGKGNLATQFVKRDDGYVVAAVVDGSEGRLLGERPVGTEGFKIAAARKGQGITDPAFELSGFFFDAEFEAGGAALPDGKFVFEVVVGKEPGAVHEFNLVVEVFVITFEGEQVLIAQQVRQSDGHLIGALRRHAVGRRVPDVGGQRDAGIGYQMQVLKHARIAGLGGEAVGERMAQGHARFHIGIKTVAVGEAAETQAGVDFGPFAQVQFVGHIHGAFQSVEILTGGERNGAVLIAGFEATYFEIVRGEAAAETQGVARIDGVEKVGFEGGVADAAAEIEGKSGELVAYIVLIIREGEGGVGKEARIKNVVPAHGAGGVAPVEVEVEKVAVETKHIPAEVAADVEVVALAELVIDFGIEVVEEVVGNGRVVGIVFVRRINAPRDEVEIGAPPGNHERGFVFLDRAFYREARGDEADAAGGRPFFGVALFQFHVYHRGEPAAVLRREAAFVELEVFDGIGVEGAEKAEQVAGVIHHSLVQEDEILVGTAAAHKQAGSAFRSRRYAGLELQCLQNITFAQQHGQEFHISSFDFFHAHFYRAGFFAEGVGFHHHLLHLYAGAEFHVENQRFLQRYAPQFGLVAHITELQQHRIGSGQGERVKAVFVGGGADAQVFDGDGSADEGFAVAGISDFAADGVALLRHEGAGDQQQGQEDKSGNEMHGFLSVDCRSLKRGKAEAVFNGALNFYQW